MKNTLLLFSTIFVAFLTISGCGRFVVVKNGQPVSQQEYSQAQAQCQAKASQLFPYVAVTKTTVTPNPYYQMSQSLNQQTTNTNCYSLGNNLNCTSRTQAPTTLGNIPSHDVSSTTTDGNESNRRQYMQNCISGMGYQEVFVKDKK